MQWILDSQSALLSGIMGSLIGAGVIGWWVKQRMLLSNQLLKQQLESTQQLSQTQITHLQQQLSDAQQQLDELDDERDKSAYELKQAHGKLMAVVEKLRHFESIKQERQQFADELEVIREQKFQLEAQLREQTARREQEEKASQEKLQLLEQAEERLKQQFEHLANQMLETKTAKVDQHNRQSLDGLLSPLKEARRV